MDRTLLMEGTALLEDNSDEVALSMEGTTLLEDNSDEVALLMKGWIWTLDPYVVDGRVGSVRC